MLIGRFKASLTREKMGTHFTGYQLREEENNLFYDTQAEKFLKLPHPHALSS